MNIIALVLISVLTASFASAPAAAAEPQAAPSSPTAAATAQPAPPPDASTEVVLELDPYYTDVSLHIPLTQEPIKEVSDINELQVYQRLFIDSLIPRYMLLEAAVFPMPLTGVALKKYTPEFYRGFNVGSSDLNLLEAVTAGFQEPYAFSIFLGDMISFIKQGEGKVGTNKGYMGYMVSYSNEHIKRNVLIPDHNVEFEWKTKGEWVFKEQKHSWSFRIGSKIHERPDIANTMYLGFRRSNLNFASDFTKWTDNSTLDFRWDFSAKDGHLLRQEYVVGKKFPLKRWHVALKLDVGLIWEDPAKYSGALRDKDFQNLSAVIRPNIEF